MNNKPVVWHYGLMAERWAETIDETPELSYIEKVISRFGSPVLDLACGTGRLLLPLLKAGIDIDGCDISGDMLEHCRRKAALAGYNPRLYRQSMHSFNLPRTYKTIYICDSFGLAGSRDNDLETLRHCHAHLEAGGALVLNVQAEYNSPESWKLWLRENREALPQDWPEEGSQRQAIDGSMHSIYFRDVHFDPLAQSFTRQVRIEKWMDGELTTREEYTLRGNIYFKNELLLMLQAAGFKELIVTGDYTDKPATADHDEIVFTAIK